MVDRKAELRDKSIGKLLVKYSIPAIVGMLANSLYNVVDTMFIGQGAGTKALAALAVCFPIQIFTLAMGLFVGIGAASIVSRRLGAGDEETANRTAGTALTTSVILGLILLVVAMIFMDPVLKLFGATPEILPLGREYLTWVMLGSPFFAFTVASNQLVRSEGNMRLSMFTMILGSVVNAGIDPILIFDWGAGLGLKGAAISTMIANITTFLFMLSYFVRGKSLLKIRPKYLLPDLSLYPEIFGIGASSFVRTMAGSLLTIVANNTITEYGEELHLAILGISMRITIFFLMPLFGVVQGLRPILGFNYRAAEWDRTKRALTTALKFSVLYCTVCFLPLMFFPRHIIGAFGDDPALGTVGGPALRIIVLAMPIIGLQVIGASLFQALGKAFAAMFLSTSRQVLFLVPLILILPHYMGIDGVWWAFPIADVSATVITMFWVRFQVCEFDNRDCGPPGVGT